MSEIQRKVIVNPATSRFEFSAVQDVEPILSDNAKLRNAPRASNRLWLNGRSWVRVASIPDIFLEQLWQGGVKFNEPDFLPRIKPMLNSAEFEKLRTAPGRI